MIGKITQGRGSFNALIAYILDKDKNAELVDSQGVLTTSSYDIANSMNIQAELNPRLGLKVGHISLSFHKNDMPKLSDEFLVKVAREYLKMMGIKDTQYIIGRHFDKEHPHIHIAYNRVNNLGQTISDKNIKLRNAKITNELTLKYDLYYGKGKQDVKLHRLREPQKTKHEIYHAIKNGIGNSKSIEELIKELKSKGIETTFRYKKGTNDIQGIVFQKGKFTFSGSKIDKSMSYNQLAKHFGVDIEIKNIKESRSIHEAVRENNELKNTILGAMNILATDNGSEVEQNNNNPKKKKGVKR